MVVIFHINCITHGILHWHPKPNNTGKHTRCVKNTERNFTVSFKSAGPGETSGLWKAPLPATPAAGPGSSRCPYGKECLPGCEAVAEPPRTSAARGEPGPPPRWRETAPPEVRCGPACAAVRRGRGPGRPQGGAKPGAPPHGTAEASQVKGGPAHLPRGPRIPPRRPGTALTGRLPPRPAPEAPPGHAPGHV